MDLTQQLHYNKHLELKLSFSITLVHKNYSIDVIHFGGMSLMRML